ncbi:MAG: hypothetical protein HN597_03600 [Desulfobacula sp.]|jgi:hypothetical protein|uniref:Uncharacterized protein n=1 Tax=uncultured marine virus TaxID=186617 RepID=A0A0F7L4V4_9VIRU|nr:hypothetical protein [uncultured marine virus]MBT7628775.1 hypothetical protein [Desulfobacula sp.]
MDIGSVVGGIIGGLSGVPGGSALGGMIGGQFGGFGEPSGFGPGEGPGGSLGGAAADGSFGGAGGFGDPAPGPDGPGGMTPYNPSLLGQAIPGQSPAGGGSIADQIFNLTSSLRGNYIDQLTDFTEGNFNIATNPMWSGGRAAIEDQYNVARNNILGGMPTGGELNEALTNVDIGRAKSLTELISNIETDMMNKTYQAAFGAVPSSIGAQTSSANQAASIQAQEEASDNAMMMQIGVGLASLFSDK